MLDTERTLLQQYDREQQPGYHDGREDGRIAGYRVGQGHGAEAERARCAAIVAKLRRRLTGSTAKSLAAEALMQIERGV